LPSVVRNSITREMNRLRTEHRASASNARAERACVQVEIVQWSEIDCAQVQQLREVPIIALRAQSLTAQAH
jgi:hypothetical protein